MEDFFLMEELSKLLRAKRRARGGIDFDLPECKISLDENGRPLEIGPYDRNEATKIIEDFMGISVKTASDFYHSFISSYSFTIYFIKNSI